MTRVTLKNEFKLHEINYDGSEACIELIKRLLGEEHCLIKDDGSVTLTSNLKVRPVNDITVGSTFNILCCRGLAVPSVSMEPLFNKLKMLLKSTRESNFDKVFSAEGMNSKERLRLDMYVVYCNMEALGTRKMVFNNKSELVCDKKKGELVLRHKYPDSDNVWSEFSIADDRFLLYIPHLDQWFRASSWFVGRFCHVLLPRIVARLQSTNQRQLWLSEINVEGDEGLCTVTAEYFGRSRIEMNHDLLKQIFTGNPRLGDFHLKQGHFDVRTVKQEEHWKSIARSFQYDFDLVEYPAHDDQEAHVEYVLRKGSDFSMHSMTSHAVLLINGDCVIPISPRYTLKLMYSSYYEPDNDFRMQIV